MEVKGVLGWQMHKTGCWVGVIGKVILEKMNSTAHYEWLVD